MKHAFLITAYKDFEQLIDLVKVLDRLYACGIYIHIDKKSKKQAEFILPILNEISSVRFIGAGYKVNWGGFNNLRAQLLLLKKAHGDLLGYDYYHLITAQDFPLCGDLEFDKRLGEFNNSFIYTEKFPVEGWKEGGFTRVKYYHFLNVFNLRNKTQLKLYNYSIKLQKFLGINRKYSICFTKNSPYWSLTDDAVSKVLQYIKRGYLNLFRYTYIPEEVFFGTLFTIEGLPHINHSLRFEDWDEDKNKTVPAFLYSTTHPEVLSETKCLFARKFDFNSVLSKELIGEIKTKLLKL